MRNPPLPVPPPEAVLAAVAPTVAHLQACGLRHALIGGVAMAAYGSGLPPRDVDLVVEEADPSRAAGLLERFRADGFSVRNAPERRFLAPGRITNLARDGLRIDLVPAVPAFYRELLSHARPMEIAGVVAPVAVPEDLLLSKILVPRPKDFLHLLHFLKALAPGLDLEELLRQGERMTCPSQDRCWTRPPTESHHHDGAVYVGAAAGVALGLAAGAGTAGAWSLGGVAAASAMAGASLAGLGLGLLHAYAAFRARFRLGLPRRIQWNLALVGLPLGLGAAAVGGVILGPVLGAALGLGVAAGLFASLKPRPRLPYLGGGFFRSARQG